MSVICMPFVICETTSAKKVFGGQEKSNHPFKNTCQKLTWCWGANWQPFIQIQMLRIHSMKSNQDLLVSYRRQYSKDTSSIFWHLLSIYPSTEVLLSCSSTFSHHPAQPFIVTWHSNINRKRHSCNQTYNVVKSNLNLTKLFTLRKTNENEFALYPFDA